MESFNQNQFEAATGLKRTFVQDNHSRSVQGVLRGLHYQTQHAQGKLVRVTHGSVFDVVVDLRRGSPAFGRHATFLLSSSQPEQLWIPEGLAHGFLVLSERAVVSYAVTAPYHPASEQVLRWDDPALAIAWQLDGRQPLLSAKDAAGQSWGEAPTFS